MPRFLHRHRSAELLSSLPVIGDLSRLSRSHSLRLSKRRRGDKECRQKKTIAKGRADLELLSQSTNSSQGVSNEASDSEKAFDTCESSETYLLDFDARDALSQERRCEESESLVPLHENAIARCLAHDNEKDSDQHQEHINARKGSDATSTTSTHTIRRYPERAGALRLPYLDESHFEDLFVSAYDLWTERTQSYPAQSPAAQDLSWSSDLASNSSIESIHYSIKRHGSETSASRALSQERGLHSQSKWSESYSSFQTAAPACPSEVTLSQASTQSGRLIVKSPYDANVEKTYAEERLLESLRRLKDSSTDSDRTHDQATELGSALHNQSNVKPVEFPIRKTRGLTTAIVRPLEALIEECLRFHDNGSEGEEYIPPVPPPTSSPIKRQWRNEHKNYFPPGSRDLPQDFVVRICNEYRKEVEGRSSNYQQGPRKAIQHPFLIQRRA